MPQYECIIIAKAGRSQPTVTMMKNLGNVVQQNGGNVRNINVLGDRILTRALKDRYTNRFTVGRYVQFLVDCNSNTLSEMEKQAKGNTEALRIRSFKVKDFYKEAEVFRRSAAYMSPIINQEEKSVKFLKALKHFKDENEEQKEKWSTD